VSATGRKTYWHLAHLGRNPTDYDIASSRLHYWTERGFEVKMPLGDWYERFQKGSELRCSDWEQWSDPRQTTYTTYTSLQHARETFVDGLLDSISEDYDSRLSQEWLAVLDRIIPPLLYPVHGLQMVSAYVGQMAPSGRITIAAAFQTADEIRRIQRLAYRIRQLQITHPEFGRNARQAWQADPLWQPLREVIERLLVTWDWGEACVALQVAVKPAFDALFMTYVGMVAEAAGDDVLKRFFFSFNEDCAWHRAWSHSLLLTAVRDNPKSATAVQRWIDHWTPPVRNAVCSFRPMFEAIPFGVSADLSTALDQHNFSKLRAES
jgi:toluene monooxygenase system protein E